MNKLLSAMTKRLLVGAGILIIALALVIGSIRLVIAQLPGYQDELKAWVTTELGVEAQFAALDARLGLYGPELDLRDVRLQAVGAERQFLDADRASLTVDPWALVRGRLAVSRLTVDGAGAAIERAEDHSVRVQGLPAVAGGIVDLVALLPRSIDVVIRDSELLYIDHLQQRSWRFDDVDLLLVRGAEGLTATARATPPDGLGERVIMSASQPTGELTVRLELDDVDLATAATFAAAGFASAAGGSGELDLVGRWRDGRLADATADVAVRELTLEGDSGPAYANVAFEAEWLRSGDSGFSLRVADLELERGGRAPRMRPSTPDGRTSPATSEWILRTSNARPAGSSPSTRPA